MMRRSLWLPRELEASHTMIMGDPRMGKSSIMRQFACQIRQWKQRAVVYDPHGEFLAQFWQEGDHLLNPLDLRGSGWDLQAELPATLPPARLSAWALAMAKSLLPERRGDQAFFAENTQRVLAELLTHRPTAAQLASWFCDAKMLDRLLSGSASQSSVAKGAPEQREGVLAELNRVTDALKTLPEVRDTPRRWSAAEWARTGTGWVFLTSDAIDRDRLRPLTSLWIELLILQRMASDRTDRAPVWFLLNEVATLNRLQHFYSAMTEGRKYGNPIIFDVQGRSQIKALYGDFAEVLLSSAAVQIFLGTKEEGAATWVANMIGKNEVQRVKKSRSSGKGARDSEMLDIRDEYLVSPAQIMGLPKMKGYLTMENFVVPIEVPYFDLPKVAPAFIERPAPVVRVTPPPAPDDDDLVEIVGGPTRHQTRQRP